MNNYIRGKRAKGSGDMFEKYLDGIFFEYSIKKIAFINKIEHKTKHKNTFALEKKLRTDYEGYIVRDIYTLKKLERAVPVYIEAKHVTSEKFYFPFKSIKSHQLKWLFHAYNYGCYAFLVVGFLNEQKILRIEVNQEIYNMIKSTEKNGIYTKGLSLSNWIKILDKKDIFSYNNAEILGKI